MPFVGKPASKRHGALVGRGAASVGAAQDVDVVRAAGEAEHAAVAASAARVAAARRLAGGWSRKGPYSARSVGVRRAMNGPRRAVTVPRQSRLPLPCLSLDTELIEVGEQRPDRLAPVR